MHSNRALVSEGLKSMFKHKAETTNLNQDLKVGSIRLDQTRAHPTRRPHYWIYRRFVSDPITANLTRNDL